jgi:diadenosine tetraphosphate (Ap4A) HIT family hydrolase
MNEDSPEKMCFICQRIQQIEDCSNPYFVIELETGYVVIGDYQFYNGYTLFLCKIHSRELHELEESFKQQFLQEMSLVAEAVFNTFLPKKLNIEILGNTDNHLHWHIFPRHKNDPNPTKPIWVIDEKIRKAETAKPSREKIIIMKFKLLTNINKLLDIRKRRLP